MWLKPLISIIVPVYNMAPYLDKCIQSLLDQTYQTIQVILVDDGSTDDSLSICQHYQKQDQRVNLVVQPNGGRAIARNTGLDHVTGEYIMFVDADDYVAANFCEVAMTATLQHRADITMFDFFYVEDGKASQRWILEKAGSVAQERAMETTIEYSFLFNKLFKRHLFDGIRFPVHKNYEDTLIMHRLMAQAQAIYYLPVATYYYVQRSDSVSNSFNLANERDLLSARLVQYSFFKKHYPVVAEKLIPSLVTTSFFYLAFDKDQSDRQLHETAKRIFKMHRIPTRNVSPKFYLAMIIYRVFPGLVAKCVRKFYQ